MLQEQQGSEFTAKVSQVELPCFELNLAVQSGNSQVVDSNVSVVASSDSHWLVFWSYHVEGSLSCILLDLLKKEVGLIWLPVINEVDFSVSNCDSIGKRSLAKLALEFRKIVSRDKSVLLPCDFVLKPSGQTFQVHVLAGSFALAG